MTIDSRPAVRRAKQKYYQKHKKKINARKLWVKQQKKRRLIEKGFTK